MVAPGALSRRTVAPMSSESPPSPSESLELSSAAGWVTARPPRAAEIVRRVITFPRLLVEHRDLIATSVRRELEARFQGTVLGWFWPLFHPLFLFVVYYFIFTKLLDFKIPELPAGQESAMGVYMFVGIIIWASISESLTRGCSSIVENGNLIKKLAFPSEVLPLNVTLVSQITLLFALAVFVAGCLLTPIWPAPGPQLAWALVLIPLQALFCFGLALLLGTLQVFLRDTQQVTGVLLTVWMFLTPLFWIPELMGVSIEPFLPFLRVNPIFHLVQAWRGALMGDLNVHVARLGREEYLVSTAAIPEHVWQFALWALGAYVVGYSFFVLSQRRFADEV